MADTSKFSGLNDQELLVKIKENSDYLGIIYKRCKTNCIHFMRKMTNGKVYEDELEDVFQDATIILYEKIIKSDFTLTASFQTYLNSVCRFQLLNKLKESKLTIEFEDNSDHDTDDEHPMGYKSSITDLLDDIDHTDEPLFKAIERALELLKNEGRKCYDLITQFWYHRKKMDELATIFGYTNADNAKNQKSRCQERLRVLSYNELHSN